MILEKQPKESSLHSERMKGDVYNQQVHENINSNVSDDHGHINQNEEYFIAKVISLNSLRISSSHLLKYPFYRDFFLLHIKIVHPSLLELFYFVTLKICTYLHITWIIGFIINYRIISLTLIFTTIKLHYFTLKNINFWYIKSRQEQKESSLVTF